MVEKATSESRDGRIVDLSKGGAFRQGAQVINVTGLPDGYVPPSGSLTPPPCHLHPLLPVATTVNLVITARCYPPA